MFIFRLPSGEVRLVHAVFSTKLSELPALPDNVHVIDLTLPSGLESHLISDILFPETEVVDFEQASKV